MGRRRDRGGRQDERDERRRLGRCLGRKHRYETVDLGTGVVMASPGALDRALSRLGPLDWGDVAADLIPMFRRARPLPPGFPEPLRVVLPPGVTVEFGVDIGPAYLRVDETWLERWGVTTDELTDRALQNLRRRAELVRPSSLFHGTIADVPIEVLQSGAGCASVSVLLPDELVRIFGLEPRCLIAPMRDLLVSLPVDADREFVAWLADEFEARDPNALHLEAFVLRDGRITCEAIRTLLAVV